MYEKENEWVVDTNVMNVPQSSILYIGGPAVKTKKIFNKMKQGELTPAEKGTLKYEIDKMDKIMAAIKKYDLENKFKKVIITDMGTFNAARNKWQKRSDTEQVVLATYFFRFLNQSLRRFFNKHLCDF